MMKTNGTAGKAQQGNCLKSALSLSGTVLTNGVRIQDTRTVLSICWPSPVISVSPRMSYLYSSNNVWNQHSEYGSATYVSMQQRRWWWNIRTIAMTSFQPSAASPPELICTGFSSQRKVALPPNGETNRPQTQPETTKKSKTDFFNKYKKHTKQKGTNRHNGCLLSTK